MLQNLTQNTQHTKGIKMCKRRKKALNQYVLQRNVNSKIKSLLNEEQLDLSYVRENDLLIETGGSLPKISNERRLHEKGLLVDAIIWNLGLLKSQIFRMSIEEFINKLENRILSDLHVLRRDVYDIDADCERSTKLDNYIKEAMDYFEVQLLNHKLTIKKESWNNN